MNRACTFTALATVIFVAGCGSSYEPTSQKALADCYKSEFKSAPPATVGSLQAKQVIVRDAGRQWLRFAADSATVASILKNGFESSDEREFLRETGGASIPAWWSPSSDHLTSFYSHPKWTKHFGKDSQGRAYLAHDANTKLVYFMSSASD